MTLIQSMVSLLYYLLVAYVAALLVWNFIRSRKWDEELLYLIVLIPFLLRLFRLK
jgi:hypothetical protein